MSSAEQFDRIDIQQLRDAGSVKWSMFPDTIGAFVAEMDYGTAPAITQALHAGVDAALFGYLPPRLKESMAEACAAWQRDVYGWQVTADQVQPLPDVIKGLEAAIQHYSEPGSAVIVPTPAYMPFLTVPPLLGRRVIQVPMLFTDGRYRLDLDGIAAAFRDGGGLLILCNPCNPLGRVYEIDELTALAAVVTEHGGRVFADEIHSPLVFGDRRHVPYASVSDETAAHTVTATSASKAWNLPGLKCAQLILSNDRDAEKWAEMGMLAGHGAANLGVIANTAAYSSGRPWLDGVLDYLDQNRRLLGELLAEHLPEVGYVPPEGTYIAWLDCSRLGIEGSVADFFREHAGVSLTDGTACGVAGAGGVRMIFATTRPILTRAVEAMGRAVRELDSAVA